MEPIPPDRRSEGVSNVDIEDVDQSIDSDDIEPEMNCTSNLKANETRTGESVPEQQDDWVRRSVRYAKQIGLVIETAPAIKISTACRASTKPTVAESLFKRFSEQDCDSARLEHRHKYLDTQYAFKIYLKAAMMRDRPKDAFPVIEAELRQMHDKTVWHDGMHLRNLTKMQRREIIRSSMFLKDNKYYFASGVFEKFKARLVAGGDQQGSTMYEDLSAPTATTANVFAMAALAARGKRVVATVDLGGPYLMQARKCQG